MMNGGFNSLLPVLVGLSVAVVGPLVVVPLLRRPQCTAKRAGYDLRMYRDQLADLERDGERGLLTAEEVAAARLEIQRRMLAVDREAQEAYNRGLSRRTRIALAALLGVMIPVGSLVVYAGRGQPEMADRPFAEVQAERLGLDRNKVAELRQEMNGLIDSLARSPADQNGWIHLGQLHATLGEHGLALTAFDRALQMGPVNADTWASVGESNVLASDGAVTERARAAFVSALRQERYNPRAMYYLGLAQVQAGDSKAALAIWRELSAHSGADSDWMPMLRSRMAQVARSEGLLPVAVRPAHPLDLIDGKATVEIDPQAASAAQAEKAQADGQQQMIAGMVQTLEKRLQASPGDFDGWMMLGRSRMVMKDPQAAADAYGKAAALKPQAVEPLFNQAMALISAADAAEREQPDPQFFAVVETVEKIAPDSPDTLYLGGLAASLRGEKDKARKLWTDLLKTIPEDSKAHQALQSQIDQL